MKKILLSSIALIGISSIFSSCLKKDEYGTNITEHKGIAFTQAKALSPNILPGDSIALKLGVDASATPVVLASDVNISLESDQPASSDITVNVAIKNALVPSSTVIDPVNGLYTPLSAAQITFPATVTIAKGATNVRLPLTITNPSLLDPTATYAVGLTITQVSGGDGVQIVANKQDIIVAFAIKNQYDGTYTLDFQNYHPTANPDYSGFVLAGEQMVTSGPNSVKLFFIELGNYGNPAKISGSLSYYGTQEPEYTIDPVTKKVTVQNVAAGAVTTYTMNPSYDSHWDPATKTIYAKWGYSYVAGTFVIGVSREWTQVFKYTGPR